MRILYSTDDKRDVGVIGVIFFLLFGSMCIIQLCRLLLLQKKPEFNLQIVYHVISFSGAACDASYFTLMAVHNSYTTNGYVFHMLGMFCFAMSFIAVVLRWNQVFKFHDLSLVMTWATYLLIGGNVVVTTVAVIESVKIDDYEKYITLWPYKAVAILNGFTIFIYSLGLYFYAQYVRSKLIIPPESQVSRRPLQESSHEEEMAAQDLEKRLLKMNIVLGLCSLCYFFRVVCLSFVLIDVERSETSTDSISLFLWFTLSLWIPSLGSGLVLLYTMRPSQEAAPTSGARRWLRYTALSSDPSCGSSTSASYDPSQYASSVASTDSSCGQRSSSDTLYHSLQAATPLLSDDLDHDVAFRFETRLHKSQYRTESLSTGTLQTTTLDEVFSGLEVTDSP